MVSTDASSELRYGPVHASQILLIVVVVAANRLEVLETIDSCAGARVLLAEVHLFFDQIIE
jgi:hypothetical protein